MDKDNQETSKRLKEMAIGNGGIALLPWEKGVEPPETFKVQVTVR